MTSIRSMWRLCAMQRYIADDLRRLDISPAVLLSGKPADDPLEAIMLLTSVGVPSNTCGTMELKKCIHPKAAAPLHCAN